MGQYGPGGGRRRGSDMTKPDDCWCIQVWSVSAGMDSDQWFMEINTSGLVSWFQNNNKHDTNQPTHHPPTAGLILRKHICSEAIILWQTVKVLMTGLVHTTVYCVHMWWNLNWIDINQTWGQSYCAQWAERMRPSSRTAIWLICDLTHHSYFSSIIS